MFGWIYKKRLGEVEEKTKKSFESVNKDIDAVGKWIKHLDTNDKQLFDSVFALRQEIATLGEELSAMREGLELISEQGKNKQVFKRLPVLDKQTSVEDVQGFVQTAVQTDNIYSILKGLSSNERLIVFTLLNSDLKLSYEDIALLLGKERSTVRGQINAVKQKTEGLIHEISEKNGKKRVYIPEDIKTKLQKYAKVRGSKK